MTCARTTGELIGQAMRAALTAQAMRTFIAHDLASRLGVSIATAYRYRDEMLRQGLLQLSIKRTRPQMLEWIGPVLLADEGAKQ